MRVKDSLDHGDPWENPQVASPNFSFLFLKLEFREGHQQRMPVHCHWPARIRCSLLRPVWSGHQRGVVCALTRAAGAGVTRMLLRRGTV